MARTGNGQSERTPLLGAEYSIFSQQQKLLIIITVALSSVFSPLSANIYYPALNSIEKELNISDALVNITITSYMIFQGLSPAFVGSLSDRIGRRPIYIFCFVTYVAANLGLAFQYSFIGLLLLRCLQSTGSSSTVTLAFAVTADIVVSADRGKYIGFASMGPIIGPSLGPVLGGFISQYLGWRYIFIFLAAAATIFFALLLLFLPETCRNIVGNGSIPPTSMWNKALFPRVSNHDEPKINFPPTDAQHENSRKQANWRFPNPFLTLKLLFNFPTGFVLLYNGMLFAGYYAVTSSLTFSFHKLYDFNDVQIGFSYVSIGTGTFLSAMVNGFLIDWNYRRMATKHKIPVPEGRSFDHTAYKKTGFSIEKARLQVAIPMVIIATMSMLGYAWAIQSHLPPVTPLILLFVFGCASTAAYSGMNVLIVDLNLGSAATALAANNLVRCFLAAGGVSAIMPMINTLGPGWTFTIIAGMWVILSPLMLMLLFRKSESEEIAE